MANPLTRSLSSSLKRSLRAPSSTSVVVQRATISTTSRINRKSGEWMPGPLHPETDFVHACIEADEKTGAILTPVYQSTTFVQESVEKYLAKGFSYSRSNNPTVATLEAKVAHLEGGVGAICVATGMAATSTVMASFLQAGDHCVISNCSYGGTNRIARVQFMKFGIEFSFVDFTDIEAVKAACRPNTKLIFSETPTNPTLKLTDVQAISDVCQSLNNGCVHVCDATFATPFIMRPLDHGADLTLQSLTKFYDGHNVGVGGALVAKTPEVLEKIKLGQNMLGNILAPQVAFHILQTMKTLPLRVARQSATATKIAQWLEAHPKVDSVTYPGTTHPQKALADKYHKDGVHGGMLHFELKGGSEAGIKLMDNIERPWSLCENLGATESIITACAVMTHANMLKEDRLAVGITDGFIRVSCGIEDAADLIKALERALEAV